MFILFSEGREEHFNKILVTFMQEPIIPINRWLDYGILRRDRVWARTKPGRW